VNNWGNFSCDIILFPSKSVEPPLEPLNAYLVSYEDVNCEEPLIIPLGTEVISVKSTEPLDVK
jgi:hypothetical protein